MTNEQIIFNESLALMEKGILNGTGRMLTMTYEDGHKEQVEEPEAIHTYQTWKKLGRQVKKGQKAIAQFTIWKYVTKKNEDTEEEDEKMFMKKASWFTFEQTEPIQ